MSHQPQTKFRTTGRRRVSPRKVDMDNYLYTLVDEAGAVLDVFDLYYTTEGGGVWIMTARGDDHYSRSSTRKGDLVGDLRNWEAGGAYPE